MPPPRIPSQKRRYKGLVLLPESQGQNLAVAVSYVPYSLDSGPTLTLTHLLDVHGAACTLSHVNIHPKA